MSYHYKTLTCSDCARSFGFTAKDQGIAAEFGFEQPVRCSSCRSSRETSRRRSGRNPTPTGPIARLTSIPPLTVPAGLPL